MDPVAFTVGYFFVVYGWPIYLPVLVLVAGSLFGVVLFAIVGAVRSGFRHSRPADVDAEDDVDVAEFFEARSR